MSIELVAIDLDGTLLDSSKRISDSSQTLLRHVREARNIHIVLATARPPRTVMPFYNQLELSTPIISYNGALVYDPSSRRVLMHRPIQVDMVRRIIEIARTIYPSVLVSAEILDRWYTDRLDPHFATETSRLCAPDMIGPMDKWLNEAVTKLLLLGAPEKLSALAEHIAREFMFQLTLVQTEDNLLQITHPTVSKGQALRVVAAELGVEREQVMAIGDNANDVSMLKWAGVAVAMGNASPHALAVADFVTDHHDADGVAKALHHVIVRGLPVKNMA